MTAAETEVIGVVDSIRIQDGRFRVVRIIPEIPQGPKPYETFSGREFGPIYPGQQVHYSIDGARAPIYRERSYIKSRIDSPNDASRRSAGVWSYLSTGGIPDLTRLADSFARHFGEDLSEVFTSGGGRLSEHDSISSEDLAIIVPQVIAARQSLEGASLLGLVGLEWTIEQLVHGDLGVRGPELVMFDPFYLVSHTTAQYEDAVALADRLRLSEMDKVRLFGAGDALRHKLYRSHEIVTSSRSATRSLGEFLGSKSGSGILTRLIDEGQWAKRDDLVAPISLFIACDALADGLERLSSLSGPLDKNQYHHEGLDELGNAAVSESLRNGVTTVVAPDGASYDWVMRLRERCLTLGREVAVWAPDARGALHARVEVELTRPSSPHIVVVLDSHRFSHAELARLISGLRDGTHLVLVGDDWLWNPGLGGHAFADIVGLRKYRHVGLHGAGAAWEYRKRGVIAQGTPRVRNAPQDNTVPLIQWREPSTPFRKAGSRVMAATNLSEQVGLGAVGEVLDYSQGTLRVAFDDLPTLEVSGSLNVCGYDKVPVQMLPGILLPEMALAIESVWTKEEIYAAICACRDSLLFADASVFKTRDPKPPLNPMAATRSELWAPVGGS